MHARQFVFLNTKTRHTFRQNNRANILERLFTNFDKQTYRNNEIRSTVRLCYCMYCKHFSLAYHSGTHFLKKKLKYLASKQHE